MAIGNDVEGVGMIIDSGGEDSEMFIDRGGEGV